ncbi:MAG: DNA repair protein RecN [Clostridia bacterium]|nr:DNA repair protein RecN [Clostridia bacterium]
MLANLSIQNIAVIESVQVEFYDGFHVLTGETGAGKSILIDSIAMVLGQRTQKELIRTGANKAKVSALFYVSEEVWKLLEEHGIERTEDGSLLVERELADNGRSTCKINGSLSSVTILKEIGKYLIHIHGQQDTTLLYSAEKHIDLLDAWAGGVLKTCSEAYHEQYIEYGALRHQLESLQMDESKRAREIDVLEFQVQEIEAANLLPEEEKELEERRNILENAEKVNEVLALTYQILYEQESSAAELIGAGSAQLQTIAGIGEDFAEISGRLEDVKYSLEDVTGSIAACLEDVDYSGQELDRIHDRLDAIRTLKRKYGQSIEEILQFRDEAAQRLEVLRGSEQQCGQLEQQLSQTRQKLKQNAAELSRQRRKAAAKLEKEIETQLAELQMKGCKFKVDIQETEGFTAKGTDKIEFLIAPNVGEELRALSKIASGGELSRIMLAIKCIMAKADSNETYVFDEIDTGISGQAAEKVAQKLEKVSLQKQTIIITHSGTIAAMADHHYLIEKKVSGGRTMTGLQMLDKEGRIREIARLGSGGQITETACRHAEELLSLAAETKAGLVRAEKA